MFLRTALVLAPRCSRLAGSRRGQGPEEGRPEFRDEAARRSISTGTVRAKLAIAGDGKVSNVQVVEAEPKRVFDQAAIEALNQWRFEGTGAQRSHEVRLVFKSED